MVTNTATMSPRWWSLIVYRPNVQCSYNIKNTAILYHNDQTYKLFSEDWIIENVPNSYHLAGNCSIAERVGDICEPGVHLTESQSTHTYTKKLSYIIDYHK